MDSRKAVGNTTIAERMIVPAVETKCSEKKWNDVGEAMVGCCRKFWPRDLELPRSFQAGGDKYALDTVAERNAAWIILPFLGALRGTIAATANFE